MTKGQFQTRRQLLTRAAQTACAVGLGVGWQSGTVLAGAKQKVVVELFTSQACPKCPPANDFLVELASDPNVIPLCMPVDLWDYFGWPEAFAMPVFSRRQMGYSHRLGMKAPFTPQMVVHGQVSEWGNKKGKIRKAIEAKQTQAVGPAISLALSGNDVFVRISEGTRPPSGQALVYLAAFSSDLSFVVEGGANKGVKLPYQNRVFSLQQIGAWDGTPLNVSAVRPDNKGRPASGVAVLVQDGLSGPVLSAEQLLFDA